MENKEFLGKVIDKVETGFGKTSYLVDMGNGRKVWISEEGLTSYLNLSTVR